MLSNSLGRTSLAGDGLFQGGESNFIGGSFLCCVLILFRSGELSLLVGSTLAGDSSHP